MKTPRKRLLNTFVTISKKHQIKEKNSKKSKKS